jgi:hypothetical protein
MTIVWIDLATEVQPIIMAGGSLNRIRIPAAVIELDDG